MQLSSTRPLVSSLSVQSALQVLGADVEWRPTGKFYGGDGRPALLQLSTPTAVVIVPLLHLPSRPAALDELLTPPGANLPCMSQQKSFFKDVGSFCFQEALRGQCSVE